MASQLYNYHQNQNSIYSVDIIVCNRQNKNSKEKYPNN